MKTLILGVLSSIALLFSFQLSAQRKEIPNTLYRLVEMTDSFGTPNHIDHAFTHFFKYDELGRPVVNISDNYFPNTPYNTEADTFYYRYDSISGRLIEQYSNQISLKYYYTTNGLLNRITWSWIHKNKNAANVAPSSETWLEESPLPNNQTKLTLKYYALSIRKNKPDTMDLALCINYIKDASNNIVSSERVTSWNGITKKSAKITYSYDDKPNPMQQLSFERQYEDELDIRGLTNVVSKKSAFGYVEKRTYKYNAFGYPSICRFGTHTQYYRYERVPVKTQITQKKKEEIKVPEKNISAIQLVLYPNPATTEVNLKASGLGDGKAIVRIVDVKGNQYKAVTYYVNDLLEALIPVGGLAKGIYVLEISSAKGKVSKQLLIR